MNFNELGLHEDVARALREVGYEQPTPIQEQAIPVVLRGSDLMACAQTGTGKTAAFSLPILDKMGRPQKGDARPVRALILTPTRELALQIYENICQYARYTGRVPAVIYGGVSQVPQVDALRRGSDILIATPGRLWDLMQQKLLSVADVEYFILDEADRMLDMGFIADVRRILKFLPEERQTLLFSATMPKEIVDLAKKMLKEPESVAVESSEKPVELIEQGVYLVDKKAKRDLLHVLIKEKNIPQTLVFVRTKHAADRVTRDLCRAGLEARAIHGDKSQGARQSALKEFKDYKIPVLVATDIAARGIDIDDLPLVINFDLPNEPETYVHRIGRTGRRGQSGTALSFCDESELPYLATIEKLIKITVPPIEPPKGIALIDIAAAARYMQGHSAMMQKKPSGLRGNGSQNNNPKQPRQNKQQKPQQNTRKPRAPKQENVELASTVRVPRPQRNTTNNQQPRNNVQNKNAQPAKKQGFTQPEIRVPRNDNRQGGGQRRNGRRVPEEARADVVTPRANAALPESTAARIRAKVEAKMAERQIAIQAAESKPAIAARSNGRNRRRRTNTNK